MTGTVERSLGVGTVGIKMAVMGVVTVIWCESVGMTFIDI